MSGMKHREVWSWNRSEEMNAINDCLMDFRFIAMDSEYPGCLRETPKDAADPERYDNMRFSVDRTNLIQLGLTLFDIDGTIGGTWEINFCDFGDAGNPKSMDFLKRNGLDLDKIREQGIGIQEFFSDLTWILKRKTNITWVTFHGSYDLAYLLKHVTGRPLPISSQIFSKALARIFGGSVYDLKVLAGRYQGLSSRLGLEGLAHQLGVNRLGTAHHAGSDSELTARVFTQMSHMCDNLEESRGIVFGLGYVVNSDRRCLQRRPSGFDHQQFHHMMMVRSFYPPPPPPRRMIVPPPFGGYILMPPRVSMC